LLAAGSSPKLRAVNAELGWILAASPVYDSLRAPTRAGS
jgi:hypothetical protein